MNCTFCDAPVAEDAERCPSCSALLRRICPSCGKINPVHVEACFACGKALPALPPAPEPPKIEPATIPNPPQSWGSFALRLCGYALIALSLFAGIQMNFGEAINGLIFSFIFFFLARIKDTTDGTWEVVNRIESQLINRSRRR